MENTDERKAELEKQLADAKSHLFKPILGCEAYVSRNGRTSKSQPEDRSGYHLVLLAKNKTGYHRLCKLVSLGWMDGFYYRPRIDHEILEKYSEGIIALLGLFLVAKFIKKGGKRGNGLPKKQLCGTNVCLVIVIILNYNVIDG